MQRVWLWTAGIALAVLLLAAAWWGWQQGGLALLQLGMGVC
jgi:predicted anti-sigma-YlaC factor YlaD